MGSVWLADHLGLQSQVAVKFMSPAVADDETSIQRFRQEAKAAAEIRSPHVVQVFDHGTTDDGQLFIVMEFLEGESLGRRIRRAGPLAPRECARVIGQAAKALGRAHSRGIVHRDVKPANIFVIDSGGESFIKVLDFGVAKFSGAEAINMTAAGNMVGTPTFMSPEQLFHGKDVDYRGDLWSLSVVAYYALTGQRPFEGGTLGELCVSIKRGEFAMPSELRTGLPPDLDAFFIRAFHQDIEARFTNAKSLGQELERACGVATLMQSTPSGIASTALLQTFPGTAVTSASGAMVVPQGRARWPFVLAAVVLVATGVGAAAMVLGAGGEPAAAPEAPVAAATATAEAEVAEAAPADGAHVDVGQGDETQGDETPPDETGSTGGATASSATPTPSPPARKGPATPTKPADGTPAAPADEDDRSKRAAKQLGI